MPQPTSTFSDQVPSNCLAFCWSRSGIIREISKEGKASRRDTKSQKEVIQIRDLVKVPKARP